jgi:hypothetical protein
LEASIEAKRNKFAIPVKMGILIAVIKVIFSTIQYKWFLENWAASMAIVSVSFLLGMGLLIYTIQLQKKAFGGIISIKEAFQAAFIAILIIVSVNFVFDQLYMRVIDTTMIDRIYAGRADGLKNTPNAATKIEELKKDLALEKKETLNIGGLFLLLMKQVIQYSFLGFIFALVISRNSSVTTQ